MQPSIAERIVYGRPYDAVADDTAVPVVARPGTALVGRILIAAIFILSGIAKLTDPAGAAGYMQHVGIPNPGTLVYIAGLAELAGGLSLVFGFLTRLGAIGLFVYLVITTLYFHNFWALPEPEAKTQMVQFMKNLSIMGGLFMVIAMGPGRFSLDYAMRKPRAV
jgi:putative oxidoreductase